MKYFEVMKAIEFVILGREREREPHSFHTHREFVAETANANMYFGWIDTNTVQWIEWEKKKKIETKERMNERALFSHFVSVCH